MDILRPDITIDYDRCTKTDLIFATKRLRDEVARLAVALQATIAEKEKLAADIRAIESNVDYFADRGKVLMEIAEAAKRYQQIYCGNCFGQCDYSCYFGATAKALAGLEGGE